MTINEPITEFDFLSFVDEILTFNYVLILDLRKFLENPDDAEVKENFLEDYGNRFQAGFQHATTVLAFFLPKLPIFEELKENSKKVEGLLSSCLMYANAVPSDYEEEPCGCHLEYSSKEKHLEALRKELAEFDYLTERFPDMKGD